MNGSVPHSACDCGQQHPDAELQYRPVVSSVAPGLVVTGQPPIPSTSTTASTPEAWRSAGIDLVLDVTWRGAPLASNSTVRRVWLPVQDDGTPRDPAWFDAIATAVDGASCVLVHCHLGVARAPSVAVALLLTQGWDPFRAVDTVLHARPIATAAYAGDALAWHLGVPLSDERVRSLDEYRSRLVQTLRTPLLTRIG